MLKDCLWHQVFTFLTNSDLLALCQSEVPGPSDCACRYLFNTIECKDLLSRKYDPDAEADSSHMNRPLYELLPNLSFTKATKTGLLDSLSHLTLDKEFLNLPTALQRLALEHCNGLVSVSIKPSFYACACPSCEETRITDDSSSMRAAALDEDKVTEAYKTMVEHAARLIEFAYRIVFKNHLTIQSIDLAGPLGVHMFRIPDQDMYSMPIPMIPTQDSDEPDLIEESSKCVFPKLNSATFGRTFDCRYIVPLIDNCDHPKLKKVSIGRLQIDLCDFPIQFGKLPFIVFGPQYISFEQSCESAPHLPALYIGCVDDQLRFQGPGVFVCDEYSYLGEFKNGLNHGYGRMRSVTGEVYDGSWSCGQRNGQGMVKQASGNVIMGQWLDDSLNAVGWAITRRGPEITSNTPSSKMPSRPVWDIPRSFTYFGNWSFSNFNGWGMLSYNNTLLAYGLLNNGYFGTWGRAVKAVRAADTGDDETSGLALVWEEHEHDAFGYIVKCYQIAINVPRLSNAQVDSVESSIVVNGMDCTNLEQARQLVSEYAVGISAGSPTFKSSPSPPKDYFRPFRHAFPEEESPYVKSASHNTPTCHLTFETTRSHTPVNTATPENRADVRPPPRITSTATLSSVVLSSPKNYHNFATSVSRTPSMRSVHRSAIESIATPRASPSGPSYDSIMRNLPHRSETEGSSLDCLDNDSASHEIQSPARIATDDDVVAAVVQQPPSQTNSAARVRTGRGKSEGRDRSAMVQAMEVIDEILAHTKGDEDACDQIIELFGQFTRALYSRLHTDWLRAETQKMLDKLHQQSRLNSPLPVPDAATVPNWFKSDMLARFSVVPKSVSIEKSFEQFEEYVNAQTKRIQQEQNDKPAMPVQSSTVL